MNAISQRQMHSVQSALGALLVAATPEALPYLVKALKLLGEVPAALPIIVRFLDLVAKGGGFLDIGVVRRAALAATSEYTSEKLALEWLRLSVYKLPNKRPPGVDAVAWKRIRERAAHG